MTDPSEPISSRNLVLQLAHILCKQRDAKNLTVQAHYNRNSYRTLWHTAQFKTGLRFFADRPLAQMTESASISNTPLTKLLWKPYGSFNFMSVTLDTVTVDLDGIQNTKPVNKANFAPGNDRRKTEPTKIIRHHTQITARMETKLTEMVLT